MELSPNDIRNADFAVSMRGYEKQEVKKYLEQVAAALEKIKQDNLRQSMEIDSLKAQLTGLRAFEDTIKSAAIDARRNADMTVASAKRDAEQILAHARREAELSLGDRASKVRELEQQIESLELTKKSYIGKVRMLLQSHLEIVDEIASGSQMAAPEMPAKQEELQVTDSSEITRRSRETVATQPSHPQPTHFEEANAVGNIIAVKAADIMPPTPRPQVDPELAAALEQYAHHGGSKLESERTTYSRSQQHQQPEASNQDILQGLSPVVGDTRDISVNQSGKIQTIPSENSGMGSNVISFDQLGKPMPSATSGQIGPESLAAELDRVVAKFEEEIAKAERNG